MGLKKNILNNGFATTLSKGIRVLEQLFLVPFFIAAWGPEYYGEWLTLTIIPSVLAFSDLGFGSAAANTVVLRYASGDKKGAANMAKSGFWIITTIVIIGISLSILTLFILKN
jgi:O-antigen/teichoic acid export membrane protein